MPSACWSLLEAFAQDPLNRGFFNLNFGYQATSRELDENGTFSLYDETGTVEGTRKVDPGPVADVAAGFRVWRNVLVGAGYSWFSDKGDVELDARVPDPLHYDRPRAATLTLTGAEHTEQAVHTQVLLYFPFGEKLDVTVGGGPSFFFLKQDVLDQVNALEGSTLTVTGTTKSVSKSGVGYNVGADVNYMFTGMLGAGAFVRYSGASIDMPAGENETKGVTVGGLQVGGGLRVRF